MLFVHSHFSSFFWCFGKLYSFSPCLPFANSGRTKRFSLFRSVDASLYALYPTDGHHVPAYRYIGGQNESTQKKSMFHPFIIRFDGVVQNLVAGVERVPPFVVEDDIHAVFSGTSVLNLVL